MDPGETDAVIIPLSRTKGILLILVALAFVGGGVWMWSIADTQTRFNPLYVKGVAVVGAAFSGLCATYGFIKLFDSTPGLIIDREGIVDNSSAVAAGRIPWDEITGLKVVEMTGGRFLVIEVANPQKYVNRGGSFKRMLNAANMKMTGSPINITSTSLGVNFDELLRVLTVALEKYKEGDRSRPRT